MLCLIGAFIGVCDQYWYFGIETCMLYAVLSGFIVDSNRDAQIARDVHLLYNWL